MALDVPLRYRAAEVLDVPLECVEMLDRLRPDMGVRVLETHVRGDQLYAVAWIVSAENLQRIPAPVLRDAWKRERDGQLIRAGLVARRSPSCRMCSRDEGDDVGVIIEGLCGDCRRTWA